jgi:protein TonB
VKVRFLVDEQGGVSNASVLEAEPDDIFDQSVIRCVSAWRFKPGTVGGHSGEGLGETTIRFELQ